MIIDQDFRDDEMNRTRWMKPWGPWSLLLLRFALSFVARERERERERTTQETCPGIALETWNENCRWSRRTDYVWSLLKLWILDNYSNWGSTINYLSRFRENQIMKRNEWTKNEAQKVVQRINIINWFRQATSHQGSFCTLNIETQEEIDRYRPQPCHFPHVYSAAAVDLQYGYWILLSISKPWY